LEQFFIMKKYRRRGIGSAVAFALFDCLPGNWQVGQMPSNIKAQNFWRNTIRSYTGAMLHETEINTDAGLSVVQHFSSRKRSDA
jgi:predicted acetyltransferase